MGDVLDPCRGSFSSGEKEIERGEIREMDEGNVITDQIDHSVCVENEFAVFQLSIQKGWTNLVFMTCIASWKKKSYTRSYLI